MNKARGCYKIRVWFNLFVSLVLLPSTEEDALRRKKARGKKHRSDNNPGASLDIFEEVLDQVRMVVYEQ